MWMGLDGYDWAAAFEGSTAATSKTNGVSGRIAVRHAAPRARILVGATMLFPE
jgi:hypothetical protein